MCLGTGLLICLLTKIPTGTANAQKRVFILSPKLRPLLYGDLGAVSGAGDCVTASVWQELVLELGGRASPQPTYKFHT